MKTLKIAIIVLLASCSTAEKIGEQGIQQIIKNPEGKGLGFEIEFQKGKAHNYPTYSFWIEDLEGNYIQTLFVTRFVATGSYGYAHLETGKWSKSEGPAERPATLPYWLHKRNVKNKKGTLLPTSEEPVPDAYTSATPKANFILKSKADSELPKKFRLLMEINQPWDSNLFWNNAKDPSDWNYSTSLQPALVYAVTIDTSEKNVEYFLNPIGHSHWSGKDGNLFTDLTTVTTAKNIVEKVKVRITK